MGRDVILGLALAFIGVLAYLTFRVLLEEGFDILVGMSLVILALLGFGVIGALTQRDDR